MRISISSPIPDLGSIPGPSRPGYGPSGSYDFQFEVTGAVTIKANAADTGNFRVSWPSGHVDILSGNNPSVVAPDATPGIVSINNEKLDDTYADEFAVVGGQTNVSKVISWGENPWSNMTNAFSGCTSLSDISTTSFISSTQGDMVTMFNGCTSLIEADIKSWDLTAGADWYGGSPFKGLVNLQKLDMTGLKVKLISRVDNAFAGIGTAVADGCEFLMSGFDMSTSTTVITPYFVDGSRIKPTSDLSNWVFNPNGFDATGMFRNFQLTGTDSILNCSGWSTFSGTRVPEFKGANTGAGDTGAKVDFTNLNVSNVNSLQTGFQSCDLSGIIGLSTWGATAGNVSIYRAFYNAKYFKFSNSDNFSNAFTASLNPSNIDQAFHLCGSAVSSNYGAAPNLNNIDLSNISSLSSTFENARFYDVPDLTTATFPSTGVSFSKTFKSLRTESLNPHIDFSNVSVKISNAREMFAVSYVDSITFGNNVDFSLCTDVYRKLYQVNFPNTVNITYPTAESGLSWAALTQPLQWFTSTTGPTTGPLTTCQVDNLIRSFHNTALNSGLTVDFLLSKITEAPSVVNTMIDELENTGGWNITSNTLDATMPFVYTGSFLTGNNITPTINTSGGTFSSSDVTVDSSTGVFNTSTAGNVTIKYTFADGCYNEQLLSVVPPFTPFKFRVTGPISIKAQPAATGSFTIDWGDGTSQTTTGSSSIASPNYPAGTYDIKINDFSDTDYCDEFAIVSGQTNVTEVLDWGETAWTNLSNAFQNCSNLTSLSNTTLTTASSCNFTSAFNNCASLQTVNLRNWDLSQGIAATSWFRGCSNLEEIDMTNSSISLYARSDNMFDSIGTSVTNGCLFKASGVDWSSTGNSQWFNMFNNSRIKKDSTFANWVFPSSMATNISFKTCVFPMQDTVLDCSGWTTYSSTSFPNFSQLNYNYNGTSQPPTSSTGFTTNITNLNVSNVTAFAYSFMYTYHDEIIGLSTLGAANGITDIKYAFYDNKFLKFTAQNNFSNTFLSSFNLNVTGNIAVDSMAFAFYKQGNALSNSEASLPPNLSGLDLSNIDSFYQTWYLAKYSNSIDFANVTMNANTAYNFSNTFRNFYLVNGNLNSLFSNTFKISNLGNTFRDARIDSVEIGSSVDLSTTTSFSLSFYNLGVDIASPTIEFADNVSFASANDWNQTFSLVGTGNTPLSTCQVDNFIRRLHATRPTAGAITYKTIDFQNSSVTESPSVVRGLADTLVNTGGYILDLYSTDATIPFEYTGDLEPDTTITPTNNTGSAFTGTFTSSNSNIAVNSSTGVINTPTGGNTTIRYTLSNGCYTEQAITVVSPFVTSWNIDNDFLNQTFTFRTATHATGNDNTYFDYEIDWGDGSATETFTNNTQPTHTYTSTGTYDIKVSGMIPGMTLGYRSGNQTLSRPEAEKLLEVKSWGDCKFSSFYYGFVGCKNMTITATDNPTFRQAGVSGYMNKLFNGCYSITSYDFTPWQTMFENLATGGMEYLCSGAKKMEYVKLPSCTMRNTGSSYNDSIFNSVGLQAGIEILNAGSGLTAGNYTTTDSGDFAIRLFEVDSNGSAVDGQVGLFNADGWAENAVFNFTGGLQVKLTKARPGCNIIMKDITWSTRPLIRSFMYNAIVDNADLSGWTIDKINNMSQWFFINNANYQQMTINMDNWTATGDGITTMQSMMIGNRYDSTGNYKGPKILKTTNWDSSVTENLTRFQALGNTSSGKYSRLREWWGLDQIKLGKVTNFSRMFEYMSYLVFKSENGRNFANNCFSNRVSVPSTVSATLLGSNMSANVDFSQESNAEIINLSGWTFDAGNPVSLSQAFYNSNHPGDDTTVSGGVWWDLSSTDMSNVSSLSSTFRRIGYYPTSSPYVNRPTEKRTIKINDLTSTLTTMHYLGQQSTITDYDFTGCDLSSVTSLERVFSANINRQSPKEPYTFTYSNTGNLNSVTNGVSFVDGSTPLRSSDYDNLLRALGSTSVTNGDFRPGASTYDGGLIFTGGRTPEQMTDTTTANKVVDENQNFVELAVSVGDIVEIRRANSNPIVYASITAVSETELTLSASIIADNNYRYYNIQTSDAAKDRFALDVTNSWYIADGGPTIE